MDDAIKLLREFGFPAAVAIFVLWRLDGHVRELARAQWELVSLVRELTRQWGNDPPER